MLVCSEHLSFNLNQIMANKESLETDLNSSSFQLSAPAHSLSIEEVLRQLFTRKEDGLTRDEAEKRLQSYGPNKLDEGEGVSIAKILLRQIANAMMLVKRPIFCVPKSQVHS
jgi:magnesium-transporting ATPase (P-type)